MSTTSIPRIMPSVLPNRDGANTTATEVLLNFAYQVDVNAFVLALDFERVVDLRKSAFRKLSVESRTDDLGDASDDIGFCSGGHEEGAKS